MLDKQLREELDAAFVADNQKRFTGEYDLNGEPIYGGSIVKIADQFDDGSSTKTIWSERDRNAEYTVTWGDWNGGDNVCKTWIITNADHSEAFSDEGSPAETIYEVPLIIIKQEVKDNG